VPLWFGFVISDCQCDSHLGLSLLELGCATCLLASSAQVWSLEAVVDGEVNVK
jgi:hypothetical protein